jgi:hypothetical protein
MSKGIVPVVDITTVYTKQIKIIIPNTTTKLRQLVGAGRNKPVDMSRRGDELFLTRSRAGGVGEPYW